MKYRIVSRDNVHHIGVIPDKAKAARTRDVTVRLTGFVIKGIITDIAFKPLELVDAPPVAENAARYDCIGT
ncbi:hypothetical protein LBMAG38_23190 [Chloroflexota bacterium]|nr:hypothetical protein LBMAG38_23190 [Chloroflexota bacterium]